MPRQPNTDRSGRSFDAATVNAVWQKGRQVSGRDPSEYRLDACGALMHRWSYGTTGTYGWEVDHIVPVAKGGSDDLTNLQPLQWQNNRGKGDDYPNWSCTVRAA